MYTFKVRNEVKNTFFDSGSYVRAFRNLSLLACFMLTVKNFVETRDIRPDI